MAMHKTLKAVILRAKTAIDLAEACLVCGTGKDVCLGSNDHVKEPEKVRLWGVLGESISP
jgi:hypothetical protein